MHQEKVLLIIPAYNEAQNIKAVVDMIRAAGDYDYVVINDGSSDSTAKICRDYGFNLVDLQVNQGLAGAFQTGMKYAKMNGYDYAIQFDADGQHLPEYIAPMLKEINKGYDIVIGSRFFNVKKAKSMRSFGAEIISLAILLTTGKRIKDPTSGMRLYNKRLISVFADNINYGPEPDTMAFLMRSGISISEVNVQMRERMAGESYLTTIASIKYMLRMTLSILLVQFARNKIFLKGEAV